MKLVNCTQIDIIGVQGSSKHEGAGIHMERNIEEDFDFTNYSLLSTQFVPLFKTFRFLGISATNYEYDSQMESFRLHKGSWLRKVIGLLLHLVTATQSFGLAKIQQIHMTNNTVLVMSKLLAFANSLVGFIMFGVLIRKGEEIREILDSIQLADKTNLKSGAKPVSRAKLRFYSIFSIVGIFLVSFCYTIGRIVEEPWIFLQEGPWNYFDEVADTQAKAFYTIFGGPQTNQSDLNFHLEQHFPQGIVIAIGIGSFLSDWWGGICRFGAPVLCTTWARVIWCLFNQFFQVFGLENCILNDLRAFNAIATIMDRLNKALGGMVLVTICCGVLHFSLNLVGIFFPSSCWFQKFTEFLMFACFSIQLITYAHVHAMAGNIFEKMKLKFQQTSPCRKSEPDCSCMKTTQGMLLILHDVQSNNLGLQGLGVFTCSYSFIGTVLSVISTYAIVVIQFQSY